ncbi:paraquat-inducible protein A [Motilimonas pumila]|uniref:Paraquat-inducible membrane protein A n=1 Tax=Motilimonas pumila TaxID=2303987 RepID=A0A418YCK9_9GAMM|nr:paraquat-inducible protein A [Motilimonas pumila]RJG42264.1 paraquat-inducible membrane protein A [Motilimonas pumila]
MLSAKDHRLTRCDSCGYLCSESPGSACPRCQHTLQTRFAYSLQKTWAYLITACICLLPANFSPITVLSTQVGDTPDTIMSGVIALYNTDNQGIAIIVFVASILVPIIKIVGIAVILVSVQWRLNIRHRTRFKMFQFIDWIGRWSMLDLFVISIMITLIDKGQLLTVIPGPGATAFALVVVFTLFAAKSFDTRLMWDLEQDNDWKH